MLELTKLKNMLTLFKQELAKRYPIASLDLFGSVVHQELYANSEIDAIVDFNNPIGIEFIALADELETKLNHKVDVVSKAGIKQKYFKGTESEIVYV